jgi:NAD(P)-dependent dehydrogenase (short-subunit alcohol dehydrogenase family)
MSKIVLITGATGGLGKAVAEYLNQADWKLVLVGRDAQKLDHCAAPAGALRIAADVSTADGATAAISKCARELGRPPNALVNCAGSVFMSRLHRTTETQYADCLAANLNTAFFTLRAFVDACLVARQRGSAVLVSSVTAQTGLVNHEVIAAAKSAVEGLTRSAAASYARDGIRINAVAPGLMRTHATEQLFVSPKAVRNLDAQYPLGRHGKPEDVAQAIGWLLAEDSEWITGQVISVDGGFTAVHPLVRAV